METSSLPQADSQALIASFDYSRRDLKGPLTMEQVRSLLVDHIARLLDRNLDFLMSALYRIDVSEQAVIHAFNTVPHRDLPDALADLIIERQLQKVRTRRAYKAQEP